MQLMTFDRTRVLFLFFGAVLPLTAVACGGSDDTEPTDTDSNDTASTGNTDQGSDSADNYVPPMASCDNAVTSGAIYLTDATNYTFDSTITVQDITVKSPADITFDWGGLTTDIFGKPVNPALDINMVLVGLFGMTHDELAENIRKDNLPISDNKGAIAFYPPSGVPYTSQTLYNFTTPDRSAMTTEDFARYFDVTQANYSYPQDTHTFILVAASGTSIGKNSRMLGFFHLDAAAPGTSVALNDNSMKLNFTTNLAHIMPVPIAAGTGAFNVSWEYMTQNALKNEFVLTQITEVMVGHYSNMTRPQLDDQFLNLREIASDTWSGEVTSGVTMDLSTLLNSKTGAAFTGVDNTGVWILALFCTKGCTNPAPWSITILQAC
jgi:hypothetical protein